MTAPCASGAVGDATAKTPPVIVVAGPAGSGKTTLGRALAAGLRAALLDLDTATAPLVDVVARLLDSADLAAGPLATATREPRYRTVVDLARDCLGCGTPVVMVGPFTRECADATAWAALASALTDGGGRPVLVWAQLPREALRARLVARGAPRDASKLADVEAHLASVPASAPAVPHHAVDTSALVDTRALLQQVLDT